MSEAEKAANLIVLMVSNVRPKLAIPLQSDSQQASAIDRLSRTLRDPTHGPTVIEAIGATQDEWSKPGMTKYAQADAERLRQFLSAVRLLAAIDLRFSPLQAALRTRSRSTRTTAGPLMSELADGRIVVGNAYTEPSHGRPSADARQIAVETETGSIYLLIPKLDTESGQPGFTLIDVDNSTFHQQKGQTYPASHIPGPGEFLFAGDKTSRITKAHAVTRFVASEEQARSVGAAAATSDSPIQKAHRTLLTNSTLGRTVSSGDRAARRLLDAAGSKDPSHETTAWPGDEIRFRGRLDTDPEILDRIDTSRAEWAASAMDGNVDAVNAVRSLAAAKKTLGFPGVDRSGVVSRSAQARSVGLGDSSLSHR